MHPELYRSGKGAPQVTLPAMDKAIGADWKKLEDNIMGEFGWKEVLKQFLDETKSTSVSAGWAGDRYQVYEQKQAGDQKQGKKLLLIARLRLASEEQGRQFFTAYSQALEKKHNKRSDEVKQGDSYRFTCPGGGVFLRCSGQDCVTLEGGDRALFDALTKELGWEAPIETVKQARQQTAIEVGAGL
jgi:hypothetical protein